MAGKRIALVVGNSNYGDGVIVSGVPDAKEMQQALEDLGFTVIPVLDGDLDTTTKALDDFKQQLSDAAVVVFFYSGHGFQLQGQSFLQPVDASADPSTTVPVETVLQALAFASKAVKLVFLDVCRTIQNLPLGAVQGLANPQAAPGDVLQSFAASPGQTAASGGVGALSPYTTALLRHIREAGLSIGDLLTLVHDELVSPDHSQSPSQAGPVPEDRSGPVRNPFYLRPPVVVAAKVERADDGLVVVLNGKVVMNQSGPGDLAQQLTLRAGSNPMELLVFNQKTFHNGQSWERTEGWGYSLLLRDANGNDLTAPGCLGQSPCFADGEDIPFKDGPHHGGVFRVAVADLFVDPMTAELTLRNVDTKVWVREAPIWARDQELLYDAPVKSLPLDQIQVLGGKVNALALIQLIEGLKLGAIKTPDLDQIFIAVRGNRAFKDFVRVCMVDRQADRIADLNKSLGAALTGDHEPFASFDAALTRCVQAVAAQQPGNPFQPGDIRVWTDLEDRSS